MIGGPSYFGGDFQFAPYFAAMLLTYGRTLYADTDRPNLQAL